MHFSYLIKLDIPQIEEDAEENKKVSADLDRIKNMSVEEVKDDIARKIDIKMLSGLTTTFARTVDNMAADYLEQFYENTDNENYLEFDDRTEEVKEEYMNERLDCMKFPNGTIVYNDEHFQIRNGKVYECKTKDFKTKFVRTKKAKKIKPVFNYPANKLYKTLYDYAIYCSYMEGPKEGTFGQYYNPNGIYDWYSLGGRWADTFLVKNDCKEYSIGYRDDEEYKAPYGYKWVAAARKKDIAWQVQEKYLKRKVINEYYETIQNVRFGKYSVSIKKLSEYLNDESFFCGVKFYMGSMYGYIDTDDEYITEDEMPETDNEKKNDKWFHMLSDFIDGLDEEAVLVEVDMHN